MAKWETREAQNAREVHVLPLGDIVDHEAVDCICGVTTEPVEQDNGSFAWLIIHYSLDGRENNE